MRRRVALPSRSDARGTSGVLSAGLSAKGRTFRTTLLLCLPISLFGVSAGETGAQTYDGDAWTTVAGAAMGFYSGSVMGVLGTMMPCNRTLTGDRCVALGVGAGAAMGMVMGGVIGAQSTNALDSRVENAAIGVVAGAVVGVGLRRVVRQYQWADVGAVALLGGALGAAPTGSLIGFGAGAATGALYWWLIPDATVADAALLSLLGVAVGGMVDWADGAASAKRDRPPTTIPLLTIRF
ncbi:MAG: hypothetical protein R3253_16370 [Longimicrobiales bacterium]|nr:hypothetical protein [Longimicrobiales bacterium]